jgi:hypothetical protein
MKKRTAKTAHTPPETILTPDLLVFRVLLPPAYIHTDFRRDLASLRKLAPQDRQRAPRVAELIAHYRDLVAHAWHAHGKESVMHGLAEGNLRPFFRFADDYGPRGLALMLADEEILAHTERWWIGSLLGDAAPRQHLSRIGDALARAGARGSTPKYLPGERTQRKKTSTLHSTHERRALRYCAQAWALYTRATRGVTDARTRRRIARDIVRQECARGGTAKHDGLKRFLHQVKHDLVKRTDRKDSPPFLSDSFRDFSA